MLKKNTTKRIYKIYEYIIWTEKFCNNFFDFFHLAKYCYFAWGACVSCATICETMCETAVEAVSAWSKKILASASAKTFSASARKSLILCMFAFLEVYLGCPRSLCFHFNAFKWFCIFVHAETCSRRKQLNIYGTSKIYQPKTAEFVITATETHKIL